MAAVGDYFDTIAAGYDSFALRAMPRHKEMLREIVRCLPDGPRDLLELGCGTGTLTAILMRRYPEASLTAIDASAEMIETARARVPANRASFTVSLFEDLDLPDASFDLIVSNMSLHHIADKGPFYKRLHGAMRPGGFFILGDELTGAMSRIRELNWNGWLEFASQKGHLSDEEITRIIQHEREFDHYETLPDQIDLLRDAGFDSVDCVWRYLIYGVFVAHA
jgi:tRNA (cmo5U34)-methyltransferase